MCCVIRARRLIGDLRLRVVYLVMDCGIIVVFFKCRKPSTAIILRSAAPLLISEMLSGIGGEET